MIFETCRNIILFVLLQKEVSSILGLDVRFISIVRDPVDLFKSLWDYGQVNPAYIFKSRLVISVVNPDYELFIQFKILIQDLSGFKG